MNPVQSVLRGCKAGSAGVRLLCPAILAGWFACAALPNLVLSASAPTEYQVKATYLYNFGKFIQWPTSRPAAGNSSFLICVLGQDPFGPTLDATVEGATIDGKQVVARRISTPQQANNCRILYISSSESSELPRILTMLDGASLLTVSDMPDFARRGGMIHLLLKHQRVRFEVNLAAAQRVGLTLSSQLLKLAVAVRTASKPGD